MLSTCLRPGFRPGLQLARITECGLNPTHYPRGVDEQDYWFDISDTSVREIVNKKKVFEQEA